MSFVCEISGEPLLSDGDDVVVVTPSGHVCWKRFILRELSESPGKDPFEPNRPLTEDMLIPLHKVPSIVPPRHPKAATTSFHGMLQNVASEYDAILLELFDTRKLLEETRQELSQALYQNDAAVRVVARLAQERDVARHDLANYQATIAAATASSTSGGPTGALTDPSLSNKKKRKFVTDVNNVTLTNDIPQDDWDIMVETWDDLHKNRKGQVKAAALHAPTDMTAYTIVDSPSIHKTKCKGITAMTVIGTIVVSAGTDKEVIFYDATEKSVVNAVSVGKAVVSLSANSSHLLVATPSAVKLFTVTGDELGQVAMKNPVAVSLHPDGIHGLVLAQDGVLTLCRITDSISPIATFQTPDTSSSSMIKATCGTLHPDGLLYMAGLENGHLQIWDLKAKKLASTLMLPSGSDGPDASVVAVQVSPNGYHIAAVHASGKVVVWDLRKQKVLHVWNDDEGSTMEHVVDVAFDDSGKYLAYGGSTGVCITTVKEWTQVTVLETKHVGSLQWMAQTLVVASKKSRALVLFGVPES